MLACFSYFSIVENTLSARHVNTMQNLEQENTLSVRHMNTMQNLEQENTLSARHIHEDHVMRIKEQQLTN
jgi:hypothetical protein